MAFKNAEERQTLRHNNLFPVFDNVDEAEAYACSRVPVSTHNEMYGLLQTYQNTVLRQTSSSNLS